MAGLKVVPPLVITDSNLTSSNVTENDYTAWSGATTYNIGDRVILTSTHKIYESLRASNTNHNPATDTSDPPYWIEVSVTNRWKMFDTSNSTQTTNSNSIVVEITPGKVVNTVALLNISATSVTVTMTDPIDGVVYNRTVSLANTSGITNWYAYFFTIIKTQTQVILTDLPAFKGAEISITISNPASTAKCAVCVVGLSSEWGEGIELGASVGIQDYSRKEKDTFGNYQLVQRSYAKRAKFSLPILNTQIDDFQDFLIENRTNPCLWIGDSTYKSTVIYGFYKDFDIVINYHVISDCDLEIEGLT